jgi:hypothetical protein
MLIYELITGWVNPFTHIIFSTYDVIVLNLHVFV